MGNGRGNTITASGGASFSAITGGTYNTIATEVLIAGIHCGNGANARNTGEYQAAGGFTASGDAQTAQHVLKIKTTNATATEFRMASYGDDVTETAAPSVTGRIKLANKQTMRIKAEIMAVNEGDQAQNASYEINAVVRRTSSAANTFLDYASTITLHEAASANWDVSIEADTTNGAIKLTATGETAKNIRWVAFVRTVEILIP